MKFTYLVLVTGLMHCACHSAPKATSASSGATSSTSASTSGAGGAGRSRAINMVDYQTNAPVPGQRAISNDAAGALVAEGDTGADGMVRLTEMPGGSISLLWSVTSTPQQLLTVDHAIDTIVDPPDAVRGFLGIGLSFHRSLLHGALTLGCAPLTYCRSR